MDDLPMLMVRTLELQTEVCLHKEHTQKLIINI